MTYTVPAECEYYSDYLRILLTSFDILTFLLAIGIKRLTSNNYTSVSKRGKFFPASVFNKFRHCVLCFNLFFYVASMQILFEIFY